MPTLIMQEVLVHGTTAVHGLNTCMWGTNVASAVVAAVQAGLRFTPGVRPLPSKAGITTALALGLGTAILSAVLAAPFRNRPTYPSRKQSPRKRSAGVTSTPIGVDKTHHRRPMLRPTIVAKLEEPVHTIEQGIFP